MFNRKRSNNIEAYCVEWQQVGTFLGRRVLVTECRMFNKPRQAQDLYDRVVEAQAMVGATVRGAKLFHQLRG